MIKKSTALVNYLLDSFDARPAAALFATPHLRIYSGTVPATADAAAGTIIATVKVGGGALTFAAAAAGVLAKSGTWEDASGTNAGGTASYWRLVTSADTDALDTTTYPRIQGTCGTSGTDMVLGSTTIPANTTFALNFFSVSILPT